MTDEHSTVTHDPWRHRTVNMRCRTCMYYVKKSRIAIANEGQADLGRCRRHAPTMSGFPVVFAHHDWCGDHKLNEDSV